jgi:hypothetical protein
MPDGERHHEERAADQRTRQQPEQAAQGTRGRDRPHQPFRQAEQEQHRGRVHEELVLHHVRAEQEAFARLVERRAHGEIEDEQRGVELDRVTRRVGHIRLQSPAQRSGEEGVQPAEEDEAADEVRLVVPVPPVDHGESLTTDHPDKHEWT